VLAGWLMLPPSKPRLRRDALSFPHAPRPHEIERGERRRTLALPALAAGGGAAEAEDEVSLTGRHDPLHVALPPAGLAIVVEAGMLFDSPAGRMLLGCLSPGESEALRDMEGRTGLAPLQQIERVAVSKGGEGTSLLLSSGDFSKLDLAAFAEGAAVERVGREAQLVELMDRTVAVWAGRMLLVGEASGVREALARLEGSAPIAPSTLEGEVYGEVYGALSGDALSRLLPAELGQRARAAERVLLHVDATGDLLLVAEVYGSDPDAIAELGRALAGALSIGRVKALHDDDRLLAELLEESRVIPDHGSFQLEVALPLASIEAALGDCARRVP
jgi:hypothetical protein